MGEFLVLDGKSPVHWYTSNSYILINTLIYVQRNPMPSFTTTTNEAREDNIYIYSSLTHWGRVTHICVGKLTIIGSDNGLSPGRRQAVFWTNTWTLLIGPLRTNFVETLVQIQIFSLKKIRLKVSSPKCCPFRIGQCVSQHHNGCNLTETRSLFVSHHLIIKCLYEMMSSRKP